MFVLLLIGFSLFFGTNSAFADHVEVKVTTAAGSGAPECETTSSGCYYPNVATVDVGGVVIFSNTDTAAHTFTSGDSPIPETVQALFESSDHVLSSKDFFCFFIL